MSRSFATVELVDNGPLRRRFLELRARGEVSYSVVAVRAGWTTPTGEPDRAKVAYCLGLTGGPRTSRPSRRPQRSTAYNNAVVLAAALGLDPVEAGV